MREHVVSEYDDVLLSNAKTAVAAIIVLDQFPRNMFRGTRRAFASDAKALAVAEAAIAKGFNTTLGVDEQLFVYLPFEHCEKADAQVRSVTLILALGSPELTPYAQAHKDIIDRFGRFPHCNAILSRTSTPSVVGFLKHPGSSF